MAMQERLTVRLDAKQIRQACEAFIGPRLAADEQALAEVPPDWSIVVKISKKRIRKSKLTLAEQARYSAEVK